MEDIELTCIKIKGQVDKIINNIGINLKDPIFRENYLKIGINNYKTKEEKLIFRSLITFYDSDGFINKYKEYNKDISKLAKYYHTDTYLVAFYIKLIKAINKY